MIKIPTLSEDSTVAQYLKSYTAFIKKSLGGNRVLDLALSLGYRSRITFKKVISGKRPIYPDELKKLEKALDLSAGERQLLHKEVEGEKLPKQETFFVSEQFFETPLNTIVLNLCGLDTAFTSENIKKTLLGVYPVEKIEESIESLLKLNLIAFVDGRLKRIFHGSITTPPGQKLLSSKAYFKNTYELADQAWGYPLDKREMQAFTIRLRSEDIPKLKDSIRKLREDISELGKKSDVNSVFQCSFAAFPIYLEERTSSESAEV